MNRAVALLLFPMLFGAPPPPPPRGAGCLAAGDSLTAVYEASGVRIIQRCSPASDIVAVRLYLLGGTQQLAERTAGIEVLLLRASGLGTEQFPGAEAHDAMDRTGSIVTLEPELDFTVFGFTGLVGDLDAAWSVFADRLVHPTLAERDVARARAQLQSAARRRYTEPDARLTAIAMQALFRSHPYALDPEGTETSLAGLTVDDVKTYAREQIVTSRMLLTIVGNVTRAHAESLVTATLGRLPRGSYRWTLPQPPARAKPRWLIEHRLIPTTYLLGLFAGPPPTSHSYWAFRVATALLSSGLHHVIRSERGLSYAAFAPYRDGAIPVGGAYVSTPKPDKALMLMVDQIRELRDQPLDYFGLSRFIDSFGFDYLAENATSAGQADFLARAELYLGGYQHGDEFSKRLHSVSPDDILRVAGQYMAAIQYAYLGDTTRMHGHW
ncbi:MAG TPA: pitrilysin family protein [Gemmatimonadales bacterium]|jgi:zinc protease